MDQAAVFAAMSIDANARTADGAPALTPSSRRPGLVSALLLAGLAGHLLTARLIGSHVAYGHHIAGFVLIAFVTGLLLIGLERLLWRGRRDFTLLSFALVQALFGLVVYILRPGMH
jgi:FtsH-binding integral membrane protein